MDIGNFFKKEKNAKKEEQDHPQQEPGYYPGVNTYSNKGIPLKGMLILVFIVAAFGVTLFLVFFTPVGNFFTAPSFQFQNSAGSFLGSSGIQKMFYQLTHPFAVQPTQAQSEHTNKHYEPTTSIAESIKVSASIIPSSVEVGTTPYSIYDRVVNVGTDTVNKFWVLLVPLASNDYSRNSFGAGLSSANINLNQNSYELIKCSKDQICTGTCDALDNIKLKDPDLCSSKYDIGDHFLLFSYNAPLPAGSSISIPISNLYIKQGNLQFKGKVAIPFYMRAFSFYVAASRLPLTFINNDYATLLYQMNKFHYSDVPATAMAGTAVKINLDAGQQPISSQTHRIVTLISFENVGSGKLFGSPTLVLILPKEVFSSPCMETYYACDSAARNTASYHALCDSNGVYNETIGGFAHKEIQWICNSINSYNSSSDYHICIVKKDIKQYSTYACTANINVNMMGSKRQTYYMTAFAVYPYMYQVPLIINAYQLGDSS